MQPLHIIVNGEKHEILIEPSATLLELLREQLGLCGTKYGCETGECGLCVVLLEDRPVLSCITLAALCEDQRVTTIEGLAGPEYERLVEAFIAEGAVQCGFCTPAMVLVLSHYLKTRPAIPVKEILTGHQCRCTGYTKIFQAVERALGHDRESSRQPS